MYELPWDRAGNTVNVFTVNFDQFIISLNKKVLTLNIWKEVHLKLEMYRKCQTVYIDLVSPKPNPILNALRPK